MAWSASLDPHRNVVSNFGLRSSFQSRVDWCEHQHDLARLGFWHVIQNVLRISEPVLLRLASRNATLTIQSFATCTMPTEGLLIFALRLSRR